MLVRVCVCLLVHKETTIHPFNSDRCGSENETSVSVRTLPNNNNNNNRIAGSIVKHMHSNPRGPTTYLSAKVSALQAQCIWRFAPASVGRKANSASARQRPARNCFLQLGPRPRPRQPRAAFRGHCQRPTRARTTQKGSHSGIKGTLGRGN